MITVQDAHRIITDLISPPRATTLPVDQASGRVLSQNVSAPFPLPRFDNSAMDGFAVRWTDTRKARPDHPVTLIQLGTVAAGHSPTIEVSPGECAQVMTGAPIPGGADAVVKVEDTGGFSENANVKIRRAVRKGENVRSKGEEIQAGEPVLTAGKPIGPVEKGILASFGITRVEVRPRPRVAVLVTGAELKKAGETLTYGQIFDSNLPVLEELCHRAGAEVTAAESLPDDPDLIREFVEKITGSCDFLVTSGGVSAGRFDHVRKVLKESGVKEHFHKVAQKPGMPLFFGSANGKLVFGLPGNPVSAFVCFIEYVWSALELWMGLTPELRIEAVLMDEFPRDPRKHRFLLGKAWVERGRIFARPSSKVGSHMLTSGAGANGILESPPGDGPLSRGQTVWVKTFPWESIRSGP